MEHFFADDGEKIHVKVSGAGPAIVLLHGWTANHQEWFPFLGELQQAHTVYRWDARAHGGHVQHTETSPTIERMAKDLHQLIEHFGIEKASAVGHSMGALTLWQYIRDFGTRHLARLCLIDQSPRLLTDDDWRLGIYGDFDQTRSARFVAELEEDFAESVLRFGALGLNTRARERYLANAPGWEKARAALQALTAKPLISVWQSLTQADYRDVLSMIDIPTLLIYGGESNFYHTETAHYVRDQIRGAILSIYDGTDHSPHQWQRQRFTRELLSFVSGEYSAGVLGQ